MKLVLIALTVELLLARLISGSWAWAVAIVVLYCTYTYIRQSILIKKYNKGNSKMDSEYSVMQQHIDRKKSYTKFQEVYPG